MNGGRLTSSSFHRFAWCVALGIACGAARTIVRRALGISRRVLRASVRHIGAGRIALRSRIETAARRKSVVSRLPGNGFLSQRREILAQLPDFGRGELDD